MFLFKHHKAVLTCCILLLPAACSAVQQYLELRTTCRLPAEGSRTLTHLCLMAPFLCGYVMPNWVVPDGVIKVDSGVP